VGEGVFEPAERACSLLVVVATTVVMVLVVPMGVLRILVSGHCLSSVVMFGAVGLRTVIAKQLPRYNSTGSVRIRQIERHGPHVSGDG